ncbi:MAG: PepSY domain-containing protein, partial [Comamonadaceae bacterium]
MRAFFTLVHRWLGLMVALFLIVAGLTGAVTSWDHELDEWLNSALYDTDSRGPFKDPMVLAAAVEAADPRAKVSYIALNFEEGHNAGYFVEPRMDPATRQPYVLGYNQVYVDPVTAEVKGRRDSTAVSLSRESLMPFLRTVHYSLHIPAMWGTDRIGYWIMGSMALVWLVDSFVALYLTTPRRQRPAAHPEHRTPGAWWQRWKPAWMLRWRAGGYRLNFDLHRAGGLWVWLFIIVIAFTSFSLNLYKEVFYPVLSLVSKTTPGPYETREMA